MSEITGRSLALNTLGTAGVQLAVHGITFLVLPLFIGELGLELYGVWATVAVVGAVLGILDLGFSDGVLRTVVAARKSGDESELARALATGSAMLWGSGLLIAAVLLLGRDLVVSFFDVPLAHQEDARRLVEVTAGAMLLAWPLKIYGVVGLAHQRVAEVRAAALIVAAVESCLMLVLISSGFGIVGIRIGTAVSNTLLSCFLTRRIAKRLLPSTPVRPWRAELRRIREISHFSAGVFVTRLLNEVGHRLDTLIVARMLGVGIVPFYVGAAKLRQVVGRTSMLLADVVTPALYELSAGRDTRRLQILMVRGARYRTMMLAPVCALGALVAPYLLPLWLGPDFASVAFWAQLYLLAPLPGGFLFVFNAAIAWGLHKERISLLVFETLVNVTLSIGLIPWFGVGAPIFGSVVSRYVGGPFMTAPYLARRLGVDLAPVYGEFIRCVGSVGLVAGLFYAIFGWVNPTAWLELIGLTAISGATLVGVSIWSLGGPEERQLAREVLGERGLLPRLPARLRGWLESPG